MLAIIAPVWSSLAKGSRIGGAQNTVSAAVNAARIFSKRYSQGDLVNALFSGSPTATYSGTAVIFTPSGEARFVYNDQHAQDTSNAYLEASGKNGYADIPGIDYLSLPTGTGIVGVTSAGSNVVFYTPPFALRFNQFGQLATDQDVIYYGTNSDGRYPISEPARGSSYDPANFDYRGGGENVQRAADGTYKLPFEAIETVSAVIVYDADKFKSAGNSLAATGTGSLNTTAINWLEANGTAMYFSPMSGLVLRKQ